MQCSCSRRWFIIPFVVLAIVLFSLLLLPSDSSSRGPSNQHREYNCTPLDLPMTLSSQLSSPTPTVLQQGNSSQRVLAVSPDCANGQALPDSGTQTVDRCNLTEAIQLLYSHEYRDADAAELQNQPCDALAPTYVGAIRLFTCKVRICDLDQHPLNVELGGVYEPRRCIARHRAAIIIPFRNRWEHLSKFLLNVHSLLQKQQLAYTIFVINQLEGSKFNRGMLLNIGSKESSNLGNFSCYIFHDVDLLPENDRNVYGCSAGFRHYSVAVDKFNYKLPYNRLVGGVLAANKQAFQSVNGFSNLYFGWGGEDDDFSRRITASGYKIDRFDENISRYKMIKHDLDKGNEQNPNRFNLLKTVDTRCRQDGLNSLVYAVKAIKYYKLFTMVDVAISEQDVMNAFMGVATQPRTRRRI